MLRKNLIAAVLILSGVSAVLFAEDKLPVEIDVQLMSKTMTMEEAKAQIKNDAKELKISKKERIKAQETLGILAAQGIPVNRAYEETGKALRTRTRLEEVAEKGNIERLRVQVAKEDVEMQLKTRNRSKQEIDEAVAVIDELVKKGVPVQQACKEVSDAVESGDRVMLKQMLNTESIKEMKRETVRERTRTNQEVDAVRQQNEKMVSETGDADTGMKTPLQQQKNKK